MPGSHFAFPQIRNNGGEVARTQRVLGNGGIHPLSTRRVDKQYRPCPARIMIILPLCGIFALDKHTESVADQLRSNLELRDGSIRNWFPCNKPLEGLCLPRLRNFTNFFPRDFLRWEISPHRHLGMRRRASVKER